MSEMQPEVTADQQTCEFIEGIARLETMDEIENRGGDHDLNGASERLDFLIKAARQIVSECTPTDPSVGNLRRI